MANRKEGKEVHPQGQAIVSEHQGAEDAIDQAALDALMDKRYGKRESKYNLRWQKQRNYNHLYGMIHNLVASQATEQMFIKKD